jgi:putative transposase
MSNYRRARYGRTFFFTVVTHGRRSILCKDRSRGVLREVLREARQARPFTIEAWVLLPDHIHCIWTLPEDDTNYSMRWGWIKKEFTKRVRITVGDGVGDGKEEMVGAAHPTVGMLSTSRLRKREGTIWQRRFWEHVIRDEADFRVHCDYIHFNPVKHGLAPRPIDWPYSTFHRFVKDGLYPESWGASRIDFPRHLGDE